MKTKYKAIIFSLLALAIAVLGAYSLRHANFAIFNPKGEIGLKERRLIYEALFLSLFVVLPVFGLTAYIAWKYRATNTKAKYSPDWDHSRKIEAVWWGVPALLILILSIMTWTSSHALDPYKALSSDVKPITIQVIALQWKWLFIYPEQNIASVNLAQFPVNTPVNFVITSDAPMNSFWIPQLGGQIYAMPGMSTQLHLIASEAGDYRGVSANISGEGFASMVFNAKASSEADFNSWVLSTQESPNVLSQTEYQVLAKPSTLDKVVYSSPDVGLYDKVVAKYMTPASDITALSSSQSGGTY